MLADRVLALVLRNFSTLFLLVALIVFPVHLVHAYVYRDVVAVADLHAEIEAFPEARQVRGVSPGDLAWFRRTQLAIGLLELALLPLVAAAVMRVARDEREGRLPTIPRAASAARHPVRALAAGADWRLMLAGAMLGVTAGWLLHAIGALLVDVAPADARWVAAGVNEATTRALAAPFVVAAWASPAVEAKADLR